MNNFATERDYAHHINKVTKQGTKIKLIFLEHFYSEIDVGYLGIVTDISMNQNNMHIRAAWQRAKGYPV